MEPASLMFEKSSDSNITVSLHPLIILTLSDQITRSKIRSLPGPIVGAILGQQKGRDITAEHGFPCNLQETKSGQWELNGEWMDTRIQQCMSRSPPPLHDSSHSHRQRRAQISTT